MEQSMEALELLVKMLQQQYPQPPSKQGEPLYTELKQADTTTNKKKGMLNHSLKKPIMQALSLTKPLHKKLPKP